MAQVSRCRPRSRHLFSFMLPSSQSNAAGVASDSCSTSEAKALVEMGPPVSDEPTYSWKRQIVGARWWRDAVLFAVGAVTVSAFLIFSGAASHADIHVGGRGHEPPCSVGKAGASLKADEVEDASSATTADSAETGGFPLQLSSPYAFVQLAYGVQIWRCMAMGRALQRVSQYPLVLLTNSTTLQDGTDLKQKLQRLNMHLLPVHAVSVPSTASSQWSTDQQLGFWKLQILRLTQFRRVILLDTDSTLTRSIDWLFDREPVWAQRDSRDCASPEIMGGEDLGKLSTGILLVEPSEDTYRSVLQYAEGSATDWWTRGHEGLIQDYFKYEVNQPVQFLEPSDAAFGMCLGSIPGLPYAERGPWDMPAFVHMSSSENECFDFNMEAQLQIVDGELINVCHYHPLGTWWRSLFCGALNITQIVDPVASNFCDDHVWYNMTGGPALQ
mmetsp:Transcript_991/g.2572  ORF Transcript_991/g.2572 Transcript_991/m.2572 type:complete len:442 (-) Transcript_991:63-1388(-)